MSTTTKLLSVASGLLILSAVVFAAPAPPPAAPPKPTDPADRAREAATIERLRAELFEQKKENAKLRAEVDALRERVAELQRPRIESRVQPGLPPPPPAHIRVAPAVPPPGRGWVEREINGMTFYLVPLDDDGSAAPAGKSARKSTARPAN